MVRKGGALLVEGRLAGREYRDREGVTRRIVEIVVAGRHGLVNVLSGRPDADADTGAETNADTGAGTDASTDTGTAMARVRAARNRRSGPARRTGMNRRCAILLLALRPGARCWFRLEPPSAQVCTGRFVNPITDVCWECLLPVSIGPISIGSATGAPDTPNPGSPICFCGSPIPRIGLSLGVWEPARLMDVSRAPWCFPNLGGLTIDPGLPAARGRTGSSGGDGASGSVWHVHYYVYPLLSWIGALLDLGCLEAGGLDIAWTSELDPAWLDDELSFLLNPEAALFANLPAQAACAADCAASSVPHCRSMRCSGAPAARAGCIR